MRDDERDAFKLYVWSIILICGGAIATGLPLLYGWVHREAPISPSGPVLTTMLCSGPFVFLVGFISLMRYTFGRCGSGVADNRRSAARREDEHGDSA